MSSDVIVRNVSRRAFLSAGLKAAAGLTLSLALPVQAKVGDAGPGLAGTDKAAAELAPNAFVRIGADDRVTVVAKHLEMGQGTYTGLATLVAEELDARWDQVDVISAPADAKRYNNLLWGAAQGTGGSTAIANSYEQMRRAGAAARVMLLEAAARIWGVDAQTLSAQDGRVFKPGTGLSASFGELADAASRLEVPVEVVLKDPAQFRLVGHPVPRKDIAAKINGSAVFTQDIQRPGMRTAMIARAPRFGAKLKSFDGEKALASSGVREVHAVPSGIAVIADHFWAAKTGRDVLRIEWDESAAFDAGSEAVFKDYATLLDKPGLPARSDGDANEALKDAQGVVRADYRFPFLAHAAMETLGCVIEQQNDGSVDMWYGAQMQTGDQYAVSKVLGIRPDQVRIHTLYAGGSFGRRANPFSDYVVEAAEVLKASGGKTPIKLVWTREDDTRGGWYRAAYMHRIEASLESDGKPAAWRNRIVGQSIVAGTAFESGMTRKGVDVTSVEGAATLPYDIPNLRVELHTTKLPVPIQWWRSVGSTHTAYATETFLDLLAREAGQDPVDYRRALLGESPRHLQVLNLVAEKGGWGKPLAKGRGRGVAVHESFNSYVAMVAEVTVKGSGRYSVDRVVVAVDCGVAVNPDIIRAQMEGGLGYGLSTVLESEITFADGAVRESNFHDYTVLRANQMPEVEVHIVPSAEAPTGVGEPATPVIGPAVANALSSVTGKRYLQLPIRRA